MANETFVERAVSNSAGIGTGSGSGTGKGDGAAPVLEQRGGQG